MLYSKKGNYMFRSILAIFRFPQYFKKSPEDGQYRPKHVVSIFRTQHLFLNKLCFWLYSILFSYTHNGDDTH